MKIAVLGGTRFIGPFIVRHLVRRGHQVSVYHRGKTVSDLPEGVQHVTIDRDITGRTAAALRENRPDAVIDMCGYRREHLEEIVAGDLGLQHYVFCSSTAVYGRIGKSTPDETTATDAKSDYECGKVACEQLLLTMHQQRQFPVTILRLAHPYGPGDNLLYGTGRDSLFLDRMRHSRAIVIPGRGDTRLHPVYVEDAAEAFVHVLCRRDCIGRIFNLSGDQILSLDQYFASIARALGKPLVAEHVPIEWFDANSHLWSDQDRKFNFAPIWCRYESAFDVAALKATGFRCRMDHDRGVAATIDWLDARGMISLSSDSDLEDIVTINVDRSPAYRM